MSEEQTQHKKSKFVDADELCRELSICRQTLTRWIDAGLFPPPLRIGLRKRLWLRREYEVCIEQAVEERDQDTDGTEQLVSGSMQDVTPANSARLFSRAVKQPDCFET